ncbi:fibropellin-1-like [Saccostrea cucullata]|uniref:fibropellin-1-like n=1 Tax=Saccostrea cuccullata TaxID=36930 RepID=UPI002ED66E61
MTLIFLIPTTSVLFFIHCASLDAITVPGEISNDVANQFLTRYRRSDSRCNRDETYCETNKISCMQHNENSREYYCGLNNPCTSGQTCYLSTPCPAHYRTGCTNNACYGQPCQHAGTCTLESSVKGYNCRCLSGYDPDTDCRSYIDYCRSNPCQNGASCSPGLNGYTCTCLPGYNGAHCENKINECISSPCIYGQCVDEVAKYTCTCDFLYVGNRCEKVNATYIITIVLGLLGIIATLLGLYIMWRKKKKQTDSTPPFPFENMKLGQTKSQFSRNATQIVKTIPQPDPVLFPDGNLGQPKIIFSSR